MKRIIIAITITCSIVAVGLDISAKKQEEKELINRIYYSQYNPKKMIQAKLDEYKQKEEYNQMIETKKQEIASYLKSSEYKLRESTRNWRLPQGISIHQIQPIQAELSFYSSLPAENGGYGMKTASGVDLRSNTVANNFLPFFTDVYIEGYGMKEVHDTGNPRYFSTSNKFDVHIPRNSGESDSQYRARVMAMGRKTIQAYIIKEK